MTFLPRLATNLRVTISSLRPGNMNVRTVYCSTINLKVIATTREKRYTTGVCASCGWNA